MFSNHAQMFIPQTECAISQEGRLLNSLGLTPKNSLNLREKNAGLEKPVE